MRRWPRSLAAVTPGTVAWPRRPGPGGL